MTDQLLGLLKFALLAALYLFFARVLWVVRAELRGSGRPLVPDAPQGLGLANDSSSATRTANRGEMPDPTNPHMSGPAVADRGSRTRRSGRRSDRRAVGGQVARLVVAEPAARRGATLSLDRELTFGRASGCSVPLPDDTYLSQIHARVFLDEGDAYVEDLRSTNGTFVNGERVTTPTLLHRGDRVQFGQTTLEAE